MDTTPDTPAEPYDAAVEPDEPSPGHAPAEGGAQQRRAEQDRQDSFQHGFTLLIGCHSILTADSAACLFAELQRTAAGAGRLLHDFLA